MKEIRLISILVLATAAVHIILQSQYSVTPFDAILWLLLVIAGSIILVWTLLKDIKAYKLSKNIRSFFFSLLCLVGIVAAVGTQLSVNSVKDKPSLLKVFYDGDYNGLGIDFKQDGTYFMDNLAIGFAEYAQGTYNLDSNRITLSPPTKGKMHHIRYMIIGNAEDGTREVVFESDSTGKIVDEHIKYNITMDNRK